MTESTSSLPLLVRILLDRIAELEAKLDAATNRPAGATPFDVTMARMRAFDEFSRQESLERLRQRPEVLAELRARHARINEFYVSRGIPPRPDPYPELP